jgi:alkanesulfonate monooxygenase SsuD/methylene tetrahydromethanopterin reductase-like flavin-dependent oxidoreductase (luciferase family)
VSRYIHVGDSVKNARNEIRKDVEFALGEWIEHDPKRFKGYVRDGENLKELTFDQFADRGMVIAGDPAQVFEQLSQYYDDIGGFGTLLIGMGKSWGKYDDRCRSMKLFMQEVAPRLAKHAASRSRVAAADKEPARMAS